MDLAKDENCEVHYLASDLPQPLPTLKEIQDASGSFPTVLNRNKVTIFGEKDREEYVIKRGRFDTMEGWNMLYLKKMTSILVPNVYAILTDKTDGRTIIVMEYMRGRTLKEAWPDLEAPQKEDIAKQLAAQFAELRALPPLGFFGGGLPPDFGDLPKKPLDDFLFSTIEGQRFGGPFEDVGQLAKGLGDCMVANCNAAFVERAKLLAGFIPKILAEGPPVFTHGDVHCRNFILRADGRVSIVDWGLCGWFPACWEYCYAMYAAQECDTDWYTYIPKFLAEYPSECCLTLILRNMHHGAIV